MAVHPTVYDTTLAVSVTAQETQTNVYKSDGLKRRIQTWPMDAG